MMCKAILEVIVDDDGIVTSRVMGTPNLTTDFKFLYSTLRDIASDNKCSRAALKDLFALDEKLSKIGLCP